VTEITRHDPGRFCWFELATIDRDAAKRFYAGLFGWTATDIPVGPGMIYTMFFSRGKDVGALYELGPDQRALGVPSHWGSYVAVPSADEIAAKVRTLGGTVIIGPIDVAGAGRLAVLRDPQGAFFRVWQPQAFMGARVVDEENAACWSELVTSDTEGAGRFYSDLFGWKPATKNSGPPGYTEWRLGNRPAGGMLQMDDLWDGIPPHWMTYFAVADCDASAARAAALGGAVRVPPSDVVDLGRSAIIQDPVGAVFSIVTPTARPTASPTE
jgi:uncharacterized protein